MEQRFKNLSLVEFQLALNVELTNKNGFERFENIF